MKPWKRALSVFCTAVLLLTLLIPTVPVNVNAATATIIQANWFEHDERFTVNAGDTFSTRIELSWHSPSSGYEVFKTRIKAVERQEGTTWTSVPVEASCTYESSFDKRYSTVTTKISEPGSYRILVECYVRHSTVDRWNTPADMLSQGWGKGVYFHLDVLEVPVDSVNLPDELHVFAYTDINMTAQVFPSNATYPQLNWSSLDSSIVFVEPLSGCVTGLKHGKAYIRAVSVQYPMLSDKCLVYVHTQEHHEAKAPTCTESGWEAYDSCTECDYTTAYKEIPALGHKEISNPSSEPNCIEPGIKGQVSCERCGLVIQEGEHLLPLGHQEQIISGKAPTCTEAGLSDGLVCSVCGEILQVQAPIDATNHLEQVVPGKVPTCTEPGLTDGLVCVICGETLRAQEPIDVADHLEQIVPGKPATCTEPGLTDGLVCATCGVTLRAQEKIDTGRHSWDGGVDTVSGTLYTCTACGETKIDDCPPLPEIDPAEDLSVWLSTESSGPSCDFVIAGEKYYYCFALCDGIVKETTSAVRLTIYNPNGSVYYTRNFSSATGSLGISIGTPGTYRLTAETIGESSVISELVFQIKEAAVETLELKSSTNALVLSNGEEKIYLWTDGNYSENVSVTWTCSNENIICTEGALTAGKLPLTVTAQTPGESVITVTAKDLQTGAVLDTLQISVTVPVPQISEYAVSYDANGGTGAPAAQRVLSEQIVTVSQVVPSREGYNFLGWAEVENGTVARYQPGDELRVTGDLVLYAVWEKQVALNNPQILVSSNTAAPGSVVSVTISLNNNPGIASMKLKVGYDSALTLESVSYNNNIGGQFALPQKLDSPVILNWIGATADVSGNITFATLNFKVPENAKNGTQYAITVSYDQDDVFNKEEENIAFETVEGTVTAVSYTPGDINDDGKLNNKDATRLMQYLSGWNVDVIPEALDVNGDGKLNNKDVTRLLKYLSGWDVEVY